MSTFSYKTHALIGETSSGAFNVVKQWQHVPTQKDCDEAKASASKIYVKFVLMNVIGEETPGNYGGEEYSTDDCCG